MMEKCNPNSLIKLLPCELQQSTELTKKWKVMLGRLHMLQGLEKKDENGFFFRSNKDLCNDCGVSKQTLTIGIRKFVQLGLIQTKRGGLNKGASLYKVLENQTSLKTQNQTSLKTQNQTSLKTQNQTSLKTQNQTSLISDREAQLLAENKELKQEIKELKKKLEKYQNQTSLISENQTSLILENQTSLISDREEFEASVPQIEEVEADEYTQSDAPTLQSLRAYFKKKVDDIQVDTDNDFYSTEGELKAECNAYRFKLVSNEFNALSSSLESMLRKKEREFVQIRQAK